MWLLGSTKASYLCGVVRSRTLWWSLHALSGQWRLCTSMLYQSRGPSAPNLNSLWSPSLPDTSVCLWIEISSLVNCICMAFNPLMPTVATWVQLKHPMPDRVKPSFVIYDIQTLSLSSECQSARMSKITNDGWTWSGTGCFIAVPIWQQWASKG